MSAIIAVGLCLVGLVTLSIAMYTFFGVSVRDLVAGAVNRAKRRRHERAVRKGKVHETNPVLEWHKARRELREAAFSDWTRQFNVAKRHHPGPQPQPETIVVPEKPQKRGYKHGEKVWDAQPEDYVELHTFAGDTIRIMDDRGSVVNAYGAWANGTTYSYPPGTPYPVHEKDVVTTSPDGSHIVTCWCAKGHYRG